MSQKKKNMTKLCWSRLFALSRAQQEMNENKVNPYVYE